MPIRSDRVEPQLSLPSRTLEYIPIIHTQADMGDLGASLQRMKASTFGRQRLIHSAEVIDKMWQEIERTVEHLPVVAGKTRVYQDGLPVCAHEARIVSETAEAGSRNYKLLLRLQSRGAVLMGTESPELLVEEYQMAVTALNSGGAGGNSPLLAMVDTNSPADPASTTSLFNVQPNPLFKQVSFSGNGN